MAGQERRARVQAVQEELLKFRPFLLERMHEMEKGFWKYEEEIKEFKFYLEEMEDETPVLSDTVINVRWKMVRDLEKMVEKQRGQEEMGKQQQGENWGEWKRALPEQQQQGSQDNRRAPSWMMDFEVSGKQKKKEEEKKSKPNDYFNPYGFFPGGTYEGQRKTSPPPLSSSPPPPYWGARGGRGLRGIVSAPVTPAAATSSAVGLAYPDDLQENQRQQDFEWDFPDERNNNGAAESNSGSGQPSVPETSNRNGNGFKFVPDWC